MIIVLLTTAEVKPGLTAHQAVCSQEPLKDVAFPPILYLNKQRLKNLRKSNRNYSSVGKQETIPNHLELLLTTAPSKFSNS